MAGCSRADRAFHPTPCARSPPPPPPSAPPQAALCSAVCKSWESHLDGPILWKAGPALCVRGGRKSIEYRRGASYALSSLCPCAPPASPTDRPPPSHFGTPVPPSPPPPPPPHPALLRAGLRLGGGPAAAAGRGRGQGGWQSTVESSGSGWRWRSVCVWGGRLHRWVDVPPTAPPLQYPTGLGAGVLHPRLGPKLTLSQPEIQKIPERRAPAPQLTRAIEPFLCGCLAAKPYRLPTAPRAAPAARACPSPASRAPARPSASSGMALAPGRSF